jgi:hypothetical protein
MGRIAILGAAAAMAGLTACGYAGDTQSSYSSTRAQCTDRASGTSSSVAQRERFASCMNSRGYNAGAMPPQ